MSHICAKMANKRPSVNQPNSQSKQRRLVEPILPVPPLIEFDTSYLHLESSWPDSQSLPARSSNNSSESDNQHNRSRSWHHMQISDAHYLKNSSAVPEPTSTDLQAPGTSVSDSQQNRAVRNPSIADGNRQQTSSATAESTGSDSITAPKPRAQPRSGQDGTATVDGRDGQSTSFPPQTNNRPPSTDQAVNTRNHLRDYQTARFEPIRAAEQQRDYVLDEIDQVLSLVTHDKRIYEVAVSMKKCFISLRRYIDATNCCRRELDGCQFQLNRIFTTAMSNMHRK